MGHVPAPERLHVSSAGYRPLAPRIPTSEALHRVSRSAGRPEPYLTRLGLFPFLTEADGRQARQVECIGEAQQDGEQQQLTTRGLHLAGQGEAAAAAAGERGALWVAGPAPARPALPQPWQPGPKIIGRSISHLWPGQARPRPAGRSRLRQGAWAWAGAGRRGSYTRGSSGKVK